MGAFLSQAFPSDATSTSCSIPQTSHTPHSSSSVVPMVSHLCVHYIAQDDPCLEYLEQHGIIDTASEARSSSIASEEWHRPSSRGQAIMSDDKIEAENTSPMSGPPDFSIKMTTSPSDTTDVSKELGSQVTLDKHHSIASDTYLPPSDSDEDLSIVTRDSIEDLPSSVPRSPKSPRLQALSDDGTESHPLNRPSSPPEAPRSPRRRLKKRLTLNLNGAEFDLEKKKRPLSPFTHGGMLRKFVPPSAPAAVTEFGPSIQEEIKSSSTSLPMEAQGKEPTRTTRVERGGKTLMGFLSRRVATK